MRGSAQQRCLQLAVLRAHTRGRAGMAVRNLPGAALGLAMRPCRQDEPASRLGQGSAAPHLEGRQRGARGRLFSAQQQQAQPQALQRRQRCGGRRAGGGGRVVGLGVAGQVGQQRVQDLGRGAQGREGLSAAAAYRRGVWSGVEWLATAAGLLGRAALAALPSSPVVQRSTTAHPTCSCSSGGAARATNGPPVTDGGSGAGHAVERSAPGPLGSSEKASHAARCGGAQRGATLR